VIVRGVGPRAVEYIALRIREPRPGRGESPLRSIWLSSASSERLLLDC
jgi:hypothetical protein